MADESKSSSWWSTLPGIITACAGLIGAITALIAALGQTGLIGKSQPSPSAKETSSPTQTAASVETKPAPAVIATPEPIPVSPNLQSAPASSAVKDATTAAPQGKQYVSRFVLNGDPNTYYVSRDNEITRVAPDATQQKAGQRMPAISADYLWHFQVGDKGYEIDKHGKLWAFAEPRSDGQPALVGHAFKIKAP